MAGGECGYSGQAQSRFWRRHTHLYRQERKTSLFWSQNTLHALTDFQISLSEIHKLVPLALQDFDFRLEDPSKSWKTHDLWFNKQTGIRVRVYRRQ